MGILTRNDEDMANQTPTKPKPTSTEELSANAEEVPCEAAATEPPIAFALATMVGVKAAILAALSAATTANAPPAFINTARQKTPPAGDCASHASR